MASQGPLSPVSSADDAGTGTVVWSNVGSPGNVGVSDDVRSVAALSSGNPNSHWLKVFFDFSIPDGALIHGVKFEVERSAHSTTIVRDRFIRMILAGVIETEEKASADDWPLSGVDGIQTYGGATDVWGHTGGLNAFLTATGINGTDFGIAISAKRISGTPNAGVDHVAATVYFSEFVAHARIVNRLAYRDESPWF